MALSRSRLDVRTIVRVAGDILQFASATFRPRPQLAAENLFLRKQLALYLERQVKPQRADDATRITLVALSRLIDWPLSAKTRDGRLNVKGALIVHCQIRVIHSADTRDISLRVS